MRLVYKFAQRRNVRESDVACVHSLGSKRAWCVWLVSAAFVLLQFFLQLSTGDIVSGLMNSFQLTALGGGIVASSYYYMYVLLQSPAGLLIDRYGPRRLLSLGAVVVALGCVLFASAGSMGMAIVGRLMMGLGAAFAFVGSLNLISKWFPANRFGFMTAMVETVGMTGSLFGGLLLATMISHVGWRYCMVAAGGLSLLIAGLLWLIVRDRPANVTLITARPSSSWWPDAKALLKNKLVWFNGIYSGCVFAVITVFVALWGVPFIQVSHHVSLSGATLACDWVFVGVALASPLIGWLDGRLNIRRYLWVGFPCVAALLLTVVIFDPQLSLFELSLCMGLLGIFSSSYVLCFVVGNQIAAPNSRGLSLGFVNMLSIGTAPLLQPLIGFLLDHQGSAISGSSGPLSYSVAAYQNSLFILIVFLILAAALGFLLPTSKRLAEQPKEVGEGADTPADTLAGSLA